MRKPKDLSLEELAQIRNEHVLEGDSDYCPGCGYYVAPEFGSCDVARLLSMYDKLQRSLRGLVPS